MKLYATIQSERATEGQGGNEYLTILIRNEERRPFLCVHAQVLTPQNARVVITDYDNERILLDGNFDLALKAVQIDAPKYISSCEHESKHAGKLHDENCGYCRIDNSAHDPRTCENSVPCFDCEQQYEFGVPRSAPAVLGNKNPKRCWAQVGDVDWCKRNATHGDYCKKHAEEFGTIKGKKEKGKNCDKCNKPLYGLVRTHHHN